MGAPRIDMQAVREVGFLRWLWVVLATVASTLKVSIQCLYMMARGRLTREYADGRAEDWSSRLLELVGLRLKVVENGFEQQPGARYVVMCNHASHYDIPISFQALLPRTVRMVAKKELSTFPIWGRAMLATDFIFIDRNNRHQAVKDLALAREKMEDGIMVWIAPEGTRSRDGRLGTLKKGGFMLALDTKAHILPLGIRGSKEILPADTLSISLNRQVEVHFGTPICAAEYGAERRDDLIAEVERQLLELAQIEKRA